MVDPIAGSICTSTHTNSTVQAARQSMAMRCAVRRLLPGMAGNHWFLIFALADQPNFLVRIKRCLVLSLPLVFCHRATPSSLGYIRINVSEGCPAPKRHGISIASSERMERR